MEIDPTLPSKIKSISDVPQPLQTTLSEALALASPPKLIVYSPPFSSGKSQIPASALLVTSDAWIIATESRNGEVGVEKSSLAETLFLELTSMLLYGELKIHFAAVGTEYAASIKYNTAGEEYFREAIDLLLAGIDPMIRAANGQAVQKISSAEDWPAKFRDELRRYLPDAHQWRAAIHWPAILSGFQRELAPAGALLVTERELVLFSEEKRTPRDLKDQAYEFGGIVTFFPRARLIDFHVSHHERFGVLALQVHATHGSGNLEIIFPSAQEQIVYHAMKHALNTGNPAIA